MRDKSFRLTVELRESDLRAVEQAAQRQGVSLSEYASCALVRMATRDVQGRPTESEDIDSHSYPPRRSLRRVIDPALIPTPEVVRQLRESLGAQLLAFTLDASVEQIDGWGNAETEPQEDHERRLREAHEVWQLVISVESPTTTRAWWMGMKDNLGGLSPAEAIAQDRASAVMSVARAFVESG